MYLFLVIPLEDNLQKCVCIYVHIDIYLSNQSTLLEHIRTMNENTVTASPVYFGRNPGELSPNGPAPVSLRHIIDVVSSNSLAALTRNKSSKHCFPNEACKNVLFQDLLAIDNCGML